MLADGAAGARVGTRFLATTESGPHPDYLAAILAAGADSTEITNVFEVCPLCASLPRARVLRSAIDAVATLDGETAGTLSLAGREIPVPKRSGLPPFRDTRGHIPAMALYAGAGVGAVGAVAPAPDVLRELVQDAVALLCAPGGRPAALRRVTAGRPVARPGMPVEVSVVTLDSSYRSS